MPPLSAATAIENALVWQARGDAYRAIVSNYNYDYNRVELAKVDARIPQVLDHVFRSQPDLNYDGRKLRLSLQHWDHPFPQIALQDDSTQREITAHVYRLIKFTMRAEEARVDLTALYFTLARDRKGLSYVDAFNRAAVIVDYDVAERLMPGWKHRYQLATGMQLSKSETNDFVLGLHAQARPNALVLPELGAT